MVITLFVMVILTALGTVVFTVGSSNQQDAGRDRLAGGALGAAEAGLAQGLAYIRANGVVSLTCDGPNPASLLCSNDWGYNYLSSGSGGHVVALSGGRQYTVWIQQIAVYSPSTGVNTGRYKIYSVGTQGAGPASRTVTSDVSVNPFGFPVGIYAEQYVRDEGAVAISKESMFSKGCIGKRGHVTFDTTANDLANPNLVPAAHSAQYISNSNIIGPDTAACNAGENKNIHKTPSPGVCNTSFAYDQDAQGGDLSLTACNASSVLNPLKPRGLTNSSFDVNALKAIGYTEPRGLPASQYAFLKQKAQAAGTYYDCIAGTPVGACSSGNLTGVILNGNTLPNAVLYARLAPGKALSIGAGTLLNYGAAFCGSRSVLIIVEGGDLDVNSALDAVTSMFVPDGVFHGNGTASIIGSLFAQQAFLNGNISFSLNACFFANFPAGALSASPFNFQEVDR